MAELTTAALPGVLRIAGVLLGLCADRLLRHRGRVEIPKTMIVERIRSRGGPEMADRADRELPEKLDPDSDADLLRGYGLDPDELRDEFRGQSPVAG